MAPIIYIDDSDDPEAPNYKHSRRDAMLRDRALVAFIRKTDHLVDCDDSDVVAVLSARSGIDDKPPGKHSKNTKKKRRKITTSSQSTSQSSHEPTPFSPLASAYDLPPLLPLLSSCGNDSESDGGDSFLRLDDTFLTDADRVTVSYLADMWQRNESRDAAACGGGSRSTEARGEDVRLRAAEASVPEYAQESFGMPDPILLRPLFVRDNRPARVFPKHMKTSERKRGPTTGRAKIASGRQSDSLFVQASWPLDVAPLCGNYNPRGLRFPVVENENGFCSCEDVCVATRCSNGDAAVYCTPECCPFMARCGNGLVPNVDFQLVRNTKTRQLAVVAVVPVAAGVIVGQYFGELIVEDSHGDIPEVNTGFRMQLKAIPTQAPRSRATIDATNHGSLMRFVNHSCDPVARFQELANGDKRTVVVLTIKPLEIGQELTVHYGPNLWFICRCGLPICCHRDIQHKPDPTFVLGRRPRPVVMKETP